MPNIMQVQCRGTVIRFTPRFHDEACSTCARRALDEATAFQMRYLVAVYLAMRVQRLFIKITFKAK